MATLHIDSESESNNDEFLFSAAKQFLALEERINSLSPDEQHLDDTLSRQTWDIVQKAEGVEPSGYIGIVSKLVIGACPLQYEAQLDEKPIYGRVEAQAVMAARQIIQQQISFAARAAEELTKQVA